MKQKSATPCKICNGTNKKGCCICGWKGKKPPKEKKEITRADRRSDFLGDIYNWMRKCNMSTTGTIGQIENETVIIVEDRGEELVILDFVGKWIVQRDLVKNIRVNDLDIKILEKFGDPLAMEAKPYQRLYRKRKNEV